MRSQKLNSWNYWIWWDICKEYMYVEKCPLSTIELLTKLNSPKPEARGPRPEARGPRPEARSRKSEVRSPKSEVRSPKSEVGSRKSEVRSPKSEVRSRKSLFRFRRSPSCKRFTSVSKCMTQLPSSAVSQLIHCGFGRFIGRLRTADS